MRERALVKAAIDSNTLRSLLRHDGVITMEALKRRCIAQVDRGHLVVVLVFMQTSSLLLSEQRSVVSLLVHGTAVVAGARMAHRN